MAVAVREARADGDFTELTLSMDAVRLTAGPLGVAPVYVAASGDRLIGSWDPVDLAPWAGLDQLCPVVVARLLTRRHRYSADTLFSGITRVTAGAAIEWSTSGLTMKYPEPARHVTAPRRLRSGADAVAHFAELMDHAVCDMSESCSGSGAVELSGGLDSANVALSPAWRDIFGQMRSMLGVIRGRD